MEEPGPELPTGGVFAVKNRTDTEDEEESRRFVEKAAVRVFQMLV